MQLLSLFLINARRSDIVTRFRLLLLPFGAIIELIALFACYVTSLFSTTKSKRMMDWFTEKLPSIYWYIGDE